MQKKRNLTSLVAFTLTPFLNSNFMILSAPFFTAKCNTVSVPYEIKITTKK